LLVTLSPQRGASSSMDFTSDYTSGLRLHGHSSSNRCASVILCDLQLLPIINHGQRPWYEEGPPPRGQIREVTPVGGAAVSQIQVIPPC
jgi:hypothetical protein